MGKVSVHTSGGGGEMPFVVGSYNGDQQSSKFISLGFTPSAVLCCDNSGRMFYPTTQYPMYFGGLAIYGSACVSASSKKSVIMVEEGGFIVYFSEGGDSIRTNSTAVHYYIAFR